MNGFAFAIAVLKTTLKAERAATADHATAAAANEGLFTTNLIEELAQRKQQRTHDYNAQLRQCAAIIDATFWPSTAASTDKPAQE